MLTQVLMNLKMRRRRSIAGLGHDHDYPISGLLLIAFNGCCLLFVELSATVENSNWIGLDWTVVDVRIPHSTRGLDSILIFASFTAPFPPSKR